ncbi:MAG: Mut7-C RNAse domain-containing protein [Candidatus Heimdallarchaeota archaeon]|nr:Mut7-C RNAse domain-containing protein [Candidatus Heimdallarchaeota archaeon]
MPDFYADSMLGKLSRFLRFFGYDTLYRSKESIEDMIKSSSENNRIVLSRSEEIVDKCTKLNVVAVFILTNDIVQQLKYLREQLDLDLSVPPHSARCSICNGRLHEKKKHDILDLIPTGTAQHYDKFWSCTECGKIYWVGSHWKDIERLVENTR